MPGGSPGVAAHVGICVKVAVRIGMVESVPFGFSGSSVSLAEVGAPKAADHGSLLGILC